MNSTKNNKIIGVTVCVNYADYFKNTLTNRDMFDHWVVVTHCDDVDTQHQCNTHSIHCINSRYVFQNGKIRKGAAINEGILDYLRYNSNEDVWIVCVDADCQVVRPKLLRNIIGSGQLSTDNLYTLHGRYNISYNDFMKIEASQTFDVEKLEDPKLDHVDLCIGYFQCWHTSQRIWYPEESLNAGLDDVLMRNWFGKRNKIFNEIAFHYGQKWVDHDGRVSPKFEG